MQNRKSALAATFVVAAALSLQVGLSSAYAAAHKVDCTQVMSELSSGKKVSEVAKEMKISRSSVYRCRKESKKSGATGTPGATGVSGGMASPGAVTTPMAAPAAH